MVLKKLSEELYAELVEQMDETFHIEVPVEKLRSSLAFIQTALARLKIELTRNDFVNQEEEIYFFKEGKPRIYSFLIFATERYVIENTMPLFGHEQQLLHLQQQLSYISRFLHQNEFLYQYYKLHATELDERYFTRNGNTGQMGFIEVPDVDPSFSTIADYLFSKFIAYEKLQTFITAEIDMRTSFERSAVKPSGKEIKWTGEGVNIVELIYGIYETGQVNEGKATIAELMDFFGQSLKINLTKYFKRFSDIKRRKSMSKTRFLDEMQQKVNKRIEDSDAWIPEDQRSRYGY